MRRLVIAHAIINFLFLAPPVFSDISEATYLRIHSDRQTLAQEQMNKGEECTVRDTTYISRVKALTDSLSWVHLPYGRFDVYVESTLSPKCRDQNLEEATMNIRYMAA